MALIQQIVAFLYVYCTDFIINLANILGVSYYEVNTMLFCIFYPLLIILSVSIYVFKLYMYRKLQKLAKNSA